MNILEFSRRGVQGWPRLGRASLYSAVIIIIIALEYTNIPTPMSGYVYFERLPYAVSHVCYISHVSITAASLLALLFLCVKSFVSRASIAYSRPKEESRTYFCRFPHFFHFRTNLRLSHFRFKRISLAESPSESCKTIFTHFTRLNFLICISSLFLYRKKNCSKRSRKASPRRAAFPGHPKNF